MRLITFAPALAILSFFVFCAGAQAADKLTLLAETGRKDDAAFIKDQLLRETMETKADIRLSFSTVSGFAEKIDRAARQESQLALIRADEAAIRQSGVLPKSEEEQRAVREKNSGRRERGEEVLPDLRAIAAVQPEYLLLLLPPQSKATTLEQFAADAPCINAESDKNPYRAGEFFAASGLDFTSGKTDKTLRLLFSVSKNFCSGAVLFSSLRDWDLSAVTAKGVRFLALSEEAVQKAVATEGSFFLPRPAPASLKEYTAPPSAGEATETTAIMQLLVTGDRTPDDVVYRLTKTLFEENLAGKSPFFSALSLENALHGVRLPLHPGAKRYYREKGILPE